MPETVRHYVVPRDHAFAHGPVFHKPATRDNARRKFDDPADGDLLWELFERFEAGAVLGKTVRLGLGARIVAPDGAPQVRIGDNCAIRGILRCEPGARLTLGEGVYVGDGAILSAMTSITIGDWTMLAHGAQVFDNDTHPTDAEQREAHFRAILGLSPPRAFTIASAPVRIGSRCWMGFNSAVMKGVTVGDDAILAAGAILTADLDAGQVAAGNPARAVQRSRSARSGLRGWTGRLFGRR